MSYDISCSEVRGGPAKLALDPMQTEWLWKSQTVDAAAAEDAEEPEIGAVRRRRTG
jgi:hypothetical protein